MNTQPIYRLWAPVYNRIFGPIFAHARQEAIDLLALQPGESLLIPGVGTGLDLPLLPGGIHVTGIDLSEAMLQRAHQHQTGDNIQLLQMNAQQLDFPDASFDAVLLNLVVSVAPDGTAAFREAWRVLRPGGRAVIFDKFLPEDARLTVGRRLIGRLVYLLGTDPNRRLSEITSTPADLTIEHDRPGLFGGTYRVLRLYKHPDVKRSNPA